MIQFLTRGRPDLPPISSKKNLDDYVTERSALLLERFCPGYDAWLTKNPPWDGIPEYEEAKIAIRAIVPVNDPGERLCAVAKRFRVSFYLPFLNAEF